MLELEKYVGKTVSVECTDGKIYEHYYVDCFTDSYDDCEHGEDSIDILKCKGALDGVILYRSEIKNITVIK